MKTMKSLAAATTLVPLGFGLVQASPALAAPAGHGRPAATSYGTHAVARPVAQRRATRSLASQTIAYRTASYRTTSAGTSTSTSTTTTSTTTTAAVTTTAVTTSTVSTTGSCTLGAATNGTTCDQAIAFMLAQKTSGSTGWHNRCLALVSQAYGGAYAGYGTASQAAAATSADGLMHTTTDLTSIPRGAVVWFTNSSGSGHVVISLGNGQAISSDVANDSVGTDSGGVGIVPLSYFTQTWGQTLIGWSAPRA